MTRLVGGCAELGLKFYVGAGLLALVPGVAAAQNSSSVAVAPVTPAAPAAAGEVAIVARDQPIAAFLRDLFGRAGRPVVPSSALTGTVNGVFRGSVDRVFGQVSRAFNLVSYSDGGALYVYATSEIAVQTLSVGRTAAERAIRAATSQRLIGGRNQLRITTDGNLVVSGVPRFIEQVTALTRGGGNTSASGGTLSAPGFGDGRPAAPVVQPLEFRVFYLRYARAEDTLITAGGRETRIPGLATIIQNLVLDQRSGGSAGAPVLGARQVRQSQARLGGLGLGATPPDASQTSILGERASINEVLGGQDGGGQGLVAPLTQDVVRIEPSPTLNALIVRDVPERMAAYDSLIRALDVEPQIVEIEATIIDINTDRLRRLGINFRFGSGGFGALFGSGNANNDGRLTVLPGSSLRDNVSNITNSAAGGTISTILGSGREFLARITALETRGAARIVQRPQIVTLANTEAVFDRTRTFYVRVAGLEQVDLFNVTAGTVLRVNPHVFRDRDQTRIRLNIAIEDGSISSQSLVENIPIVERSSVTTQAMVVDGESLLLGGMTMDADSDSVYKVPLLGDIPLLGELFKFRERTRAHTERLFLITPRLISLVGRAPVVTSSTAAPTELIRPIAPAASSGTASRESGSSGGASNSISPPK